MCCLCSENRKRSQKIDGVVYASVNFALEKSKVTFDPSKANVNLFKEKVQSLGYKVMSEKAEFDISGMTCAALLK